MFFPKEDTDREYATCDFPINSAKIKFFEFLGPLMDL